MKRKIAVVLAVALAGMMLLSGVALASGPVDVDVNFDGSSGGVVVDVNTTVPTDLDINSLGRDGSAWHTGVVGETNTFTADGVFTSHYSTSVGNYGKLGSYINASTSTGAVFTMTDTQDFNILSANHNYNTVGTFYAEASGPIADMNLKSIGSMYCWSEATNPHWASGLQGSYIEKSYLMSTSGNPTAYMDMVIGTSGLASISNSNIWGWGASENGTITTNYGGGTRTVSATGNGSYQQTGAGSTSLTFNGFSFPNGGAMQMLANYVGGMSGQYSMTAK